LVLKVVMGESPGFVRVRFVEPTMPMPGLRVLKTALKTH
jgi:hypothetical protein